MDAVPAAREFDVANVHVVADLEEDGVIGGIHEGDIADRDVAATDEDEGVRAAHALLAGPVEDLVAVDHTRAAEGDVLLAVGENQGPMPFAPPCLRQKVRRRGMLVQVGVRGADEPGPRLQEQRHAAFQMHRRREVPARGK